MPGLLMCSNLEKVRKTTKKIKIMKKKPNNIEHLLATLINCDESPYTDEVYKRLVGKMNQTPTFLNYSRLLAYEFLSSGHINKKIDPDSLDLVLESIFDEMNLTDDDFKIKETVNKSQLN